MKSNYNQLGQYIEMVSRTNSDLKYGIEDVRGCSNTKQMMQTRANLIGRTYEKFIVLRPQEFVFNRRTTRNGEKIGMAYNNTDREYIFTNDYVAFRVKQEYLDKLLPDYLYLFFCRGEFDRYARYKSTGSATEFFNWEDMCAVPVEIPPMDFQQLVVNAYKVLNEGIETKQKINDNLAETASSLFKNMFLASPDKVQWKIGTFSRFIRSTVGGDWGQETPKGNYTQEVSCIRGTDIPSLNAGSISSAPTRYILPKNFLTKRIKANDLVVEISGGSPVQSTGRIALVPQQVLGYRGDKLICSNFCRVVTVDALYMQYFLQYWLYLYKSGRMFDYENSSTGLKNFDFSSFVEKEPIRIPPESIVEKYNKLVSPLYRQLFLNGFEIEALQETQQHILPRIMLHRF